MQTENLREYAKAATIAVVQYGEALDKANADKAGLRAWSKAVENNVQP